MSAQEANDISQPPDVDSGAGNGTPLLVKNSKENIIIIRINQNESNEIRTSSELNQNEGMSEVIEEMALSHIETMYTEDYQLPENVSPQEVILPISDANQQANQVTENNSHETNTLESKDNTTQNTSQITHAVSPNQNIKPISENSSQQTSIEKDAVQDGCHLSDNHEQNIISKPHVDDTASQDPDLTTSKVQKAQYSSGNDDKQPSDCESYPNENSVENVEGNGSGHDLENDEMEETSQTLEDTHSCGKCKLVFTSLDDYVRHKLEHDNCKVTYSKSLKNKKILIPKIRVVKKRVLENPEEPPVKKKRGRPPGSKSKPVHTYNDIQVMHNYDKPYKCKQCIKTFSRDAALQRHIRWDHEAKEEIEDDDYKDNDPSDDDRDVDYKEEGFIEADDHVMLSHKQEHGYVVKRKRKVPKQYLSEEDLIDRPFMCEVCDKRFKDINIVKTHMLTHSDVRDYKCTAENCNFSFKTKGSLKRHMRRHTGERPFQCDLCKRSFTESGALTRHLRSRIPCTAKTDADLPRYKKRLGIKSKDELDSPGNAEPNTRTLRYNVNISVRGKPILKEMECSIDVDKQKEAHGVAHQTMQQDQQDSQQLIQQVDTEEEQQAIRQEEQCSEQPPGQPDGQQLERLHTDTQVNQREAQEQEGMDGDQHGGGGDDNGARKAISVYGQEESENAILNESNFTIVDMFDICDEQVIVAMEDDNKKHKDNTCKVCGEAFTDIEAFKTHLKNHVAHLPFRCGLCTFAVAQKEQLSVHMQSVHQTQLQDELEDIPTEEQTEDVSKSGKLFSEENKDAAIAIQQLLEMRDISQVATEFQSGVHGYKATMHKCPICSRSFRGLCYMRLHMRSHTGERPFSCDICSKAFVTKDALNKHMFVHSEDRSYKCGECGKLFKRISHVREHLKIHSTERPFSCSICNKTFKSHNACKVHLRTHSDNLPFQCEVCSRSFRERGSLERHLRTHTGEKPFICHKCGRKFAEHGTLNRHLKAKVPCIFTPAKKNSVDHTASNETQMVVAGDFPTVLAEFSSVVANTQQYIIQPDQVVQQVPVQQLGDAQVADAEIVVFSDEINMKTQNIEIVNESSDERAMDVDSSNQTNYVILDQTDGKLTLLNQDTGETMTYMTNDASNITVVSSDIDNIQEVTILPPDVDHVESVVVAPSNESEDTVQQAMMVADLVDDLP